MEAYYFIVLKKPFGSPTDIAIFLKKTFKIWGDPNKKEP